MHTPFLDSLLTVVPSFPIAEMPAHLLAVPERVAELTGITVVVREIDDDFKRQFPVLAKASASIDINPGEFDICVWVQPEALTPSILGHELIHLRRDVLESVPKLTALRTADGSDWNSITLLENELEHLAIIPEEIKTFPDAEQRWRVHYETALDKAITQGDLFTLALHWSQLRNSLPDQIDLAKRLAAYLRERGSEWVKCADYLREDMRQAMPDKLQMAEKLLSTLVQPLAPDLLTHIGTLRYVTAHGMLDVEVLS